MHSTSLDEQPSQRDARKSKRNTAATEALPKYSVLHPKTTKQLAKNSESHGVKDMVSDLKEESVQKDDEYVSSRKVTQKQKENSSVMEEEKNTIAPDFQVPRDFEQKFDKDFQEYIELFNKVVVDEKMNLKPLNTDFYSNQENWRLMRKLFYLCDGNYYEANALQLWKDLPKCFSPEELQSLGQDPKKFYQEYLFFFDRFSHTDKSEKALVETLQLNVENLIDPFIKYAPESQNFELNKQFFDEVMTQQSVLLKGFVSVLGVNPELFSISNVVSTHPHDHIDIVHQNPDLYGFVQDPKKTDQYKKTMTIQEYYNYQKECKMRLPQNIRDKDGRIKFAVNIDIEEWKEHMDELKSKIPPEWLFNSEKDAMKLISHKVKGINLPQIYLKVEGAWTGGHEENLRLRAINLNHGPDSCIWYTIETDYAKDFRELVKKEYNLDVHKDEGLWFADINFCIKNGIKVQYFVQEPGDIVLLGPGCLHWVKCNGITMNSAWNICSKDKVQFEKAFERYEINKQINFKTIIPMKHIALRVLLEEVSTIPVDLRLYLAKQVQKFYEEELQIYNDFIQRHPNLISVYEGEGSSVYNCIMCNHETFNFYAFCEPCSKGKKTHKTSVLICLNCYEEHLKECKSERIQIFPYYKLSPKVVIEFTQILLHLGSKALLDVIDKFENLGQVLDQLIAQDKVQQENLIYENKNIYSATDAEPNNTVPQQAEALISPQPVTNAEKDEDFPPKVFEDKVSMAEEVKDHVELPDHKKSPETLKRHKKEQQKSLKTDKISLPKEEAPKLDIDTKEYSTRKAEESEKSNSSKKKRKSDVNTPINGAPIEKAKIFNIITDQDIKPIPVEIATLPKPATESKESKRNLSTLSDEESGDDKEYTIKKKVKPNSQVQNQEIIIPTLDEHKTEDHQNIELGKGLEYYGYNELNTGNKPGVGTNQDQKNLTYFLNKLTQP